MVDDFSTDQPEAVVRTFTEPQIRYIKLGDHVVGTLNAYKKKAIEVGIGQSAGSLIVTTDADCRVQKDWLLTLADFYEKRHPAFIAAPVSLVTGGTFLGIFQALDFMSLQGITGAGVHSEFHMMCNGANLAYEKKAFSEVNGFEGIDHIASGDDMLLMQKIQRRMPGRALFFPAKEVIVETAAAPSLAAFFQQRIRWASKSGQYKDKKITIVLLIVYLFNLSLLVLPIIALFDQTKYSIFHIPYSILIYWFAMVILKTVIELIFLYPVAGFYNRRTLLWWFPLMQPFHILYTIIAGFLGRFGSYQWKGMKVK